MRIIFDGREVEIPEKKIRVKELLKKLGADELYFLVIDLEKGKLLTNDKVVKEGDKIEVRSTLSWG